MIMSLWGTRGFIYFTATRDILGIYLRKQWKSLLYWEQENLLIGTDKGKIMKFSRDQGNMLPFPESPPDMF